MTGPGGAFDMRDGIGRVVRGGVLEVVGLERLDATIAVAIEVRTEVGAHREAAPDLADRLWTGVQPQALGGLAAALERTLDHRGGILDGASPELGEYRRRLAAARRDAADLLRRLAGRLGAHLQETFTTERGGRPVLAVKASSRSAVPGIVHDTSASGNTLFVEPLELVEANNRLRELEAMEAAEVERILAEMSERVRQLRGRAGGGDRRTRRARPRAGGRPPVLRVGRLRRRGCARARARGCAPPPARPPQRGTDRPRSAGYPGAGDQRAQHRRQDRGAQDPRDARGPVAVRPARARADRAPAGVRSDPGRYRRRAVHRAQPVDVLGPRAAACRRSSGPRVRGRWCCSTRSPPAPIPTKAVRWPRRSWSAWSGPGRASW